MTCIVILHVLPQLRILSRIVLRNIWPATYAWLEQGSMYVNLAAFLYLYLYLYFAFVFAFVFFICKGAWTCIAPDLVNLSALPGVFRAESKNPVIFEVCRLWNLFWRNLFSCLNNLRELSLTRIKYSISISTRNIFSPRSQALSETFGAFPINQFLPIVFVSWCKMKNRYC